MKKLIMVWLLYISIVGMNLQANEIAYIDCSGDTPPENCDALLIDWESSINLGFRPDTFNTLVFWIDGNSMLTIAADGTITYKGEEAKTAPEVAEALLKLVSDAGCLLEKQP